MLSLLLDRMRAGRSAGRVFQLAILLLAAACHQTDRAGAPPTVFAAASAGDALDEIARAFEMAGGVRPRLSFAASSTLARQIETGAEADLFVSADETWMDYLERRGFLRAETRTDLLANRLVLIAPAASTLTLTLAPRADLAGGFKGRLSVGDPAHVPAGRYAREALERLGLWDSVKDRLAPAEDARAALQHVALGETELGIVYATDAASTRKVRVVAAFPESSHAPIRYPVALCRDARPAARRFYDFLFNDESRRIFEKHGFAVAAAQQTTSQSTPAPTASPGIFTTPLSREEWSALRLSLRVATFSALALLLPGIAAGWLLARRNFRGKILVEGLVYLPLVIPPVVIGYLLLVTLGRSGLAGRWLYETVGLRFAFTWEGAVLAAMIMAFPLMVRSVRLAMEMIDREMEDTSRTLGAGPARVFVTITLPLSTPGILAGAMLAFARSLGEFGATITFAGNIAGETRTLPLAIYSQLQRPGGELIAMRLVVLSIALSLLALIASQLVARSFQARLGGRTRAS
jgi:molybdate transport system permease protein